VEVREVEECGDWADAVGTFTATAPDGTTLNAGNIVVWKREATGAWNLQGHLQLGHRAFGPAQLIAGADATRALRSDAVPRLQHDLGQRLEVGALGRKEYQPLRRLLAPLSRPMV